MMSNKLIPTHGLLYKNNNFFKSLFFKEKTYNINAVKVVKNEQVNSNFVPTDDLKQKFELENKKQILANKLLYGEIGTSELNYTEIDEMMEYFTKDIQNIDNELLRIKQHILYMQKELKN